MGAPGSGTVILASGKQRVLLILPIPPAPTGNGLAMRAALVAEGLSREFELRVAVVPVSAGASTTSELEWIAARAERVALVPPDDGAEAIHGWMASPRGRELAAAAEPLPGRARAASPGCGERMRRALDVEAFDVIWVMRLYLAGLALPYLERDPRPRMILDLDDDDGSFYRALAALHEERGEPASDALAEAEAHDRLASHVLPLFDEVLTASVSDAGRVAERLNVKRPTTLPNAVHTDLPPSREPREGDPPKLVFVGNLDYLPNGDGLEHLVDELLPVLRGRHQGLVLHVAGAGGTKLAARWRDRDDIVFHGFAPGLDALYHGAHASVVPLRAGGGSRLKILEAFSRGVPVVATEAGAAGLDMTSGRDLLVAHSGAALIDAVSRVLDDRRLARALASAARTFVVKHHNFDLVAAQVAAVARPSA